MSNWYRHLQKTEDRGLVYKHDKTNGIECFEDAGFVESWSNVDADNPDNILSITGYIIMYGACTLL